MNSYELSRNWFDWCFENQGMVKPNHTALYFFIIEHNNRMGWVKNFGLPTTMAKAAIGISSYNTYIKTLNDLVKWDFIVMVQKSKNQYSTNIVALSKKAKALDKALDKALIKHGIKHSESIDSINKQVNKETKETNKRFYNEFLISESWIEQVAMKSKFSVLEVKKKLLDFTEMIDLKFDTKVNKKDYASHFISWLDKQEKKIEIKNIYQIPNGRF